jgi:hypothetical protein
MADDINLDIDPEVSRAHILRIGDALATFDASPANTRSEQASLGMVRAMVDQAVLVIRAKEIGGESATAPNRRLFFELMLTLSWLREDGEVAVDALLRRAQNEGEKLLRDLPELASLQKANLADLAALPLGDDKSRDRYAHVKHMAEIVAGGDGLYYTWIQETRFAHASMDLAISHAPLVNGVLGVGKPPILDLVNGMNLSLLLGFAHVHAVMERSGHKEVGSRLLDVYFSTLPKDPGPES